MATLLAKWCISSARRALFPVMVGLLLYAAVPARATHFRYGKLTWKFVGANTAEFTLVNAFRRSGYDGSASDGKPAVGDIIDEHLGSTALFFGDGTDTGQLKYKVMAINPDEDWVIAVALDPNVPNKTTITHTYPSSKDPNGHPWVAEIRSCCRISSLKNNADGDYRVQALVEFSTGNRPPDATVEPIVKIQQGTVATFPVIASDPDRDNLLRLTSPCPLSELSSLMTSFLSRR